ncbi:MAG: hypothetical protein J6Y94_05640 [Bacteriovoracaceae bacterium]|nr:hypothetical protein [Bacteriovoracaceae bacterium]
MALPMKLILVITSFLLVACPAAPIKRNFASVDQPAANFNAPLIKKKMALLPFYNQSPYGGDDLAVTVTEELRNELGRSGHFVIDQMVAKSFGPSKEVYVGGGVKLGPLVTEAKKYNINLILLGRIMEAKVQQKADEIGLVRKTKTYGEALVEFRLFDVHTNREILNEAIRGSSDDESYRFFKPNSKEELNYRREILRYVAQVAARKVIPHILAVSKQMEWVGRIANIEGTRIYINAGRASGINVGDILKVVTEGRDIYDPETGALIGTAQGEIKGAIEIVDYFGPDGAVGVLHSGGQIQKGDLVQLY